MYASGLIAVEIKGWNNLITHTSSHTIIQNEALRRKNLGGGRKWSEVGRENHSEKLRLSLNTAEFQW